MLRAYAAASGHENKAVKVGEVASVSKASSTSISLANAFFVETGLIQKSDVGFVPSPEVMAFAKAYEWGPDKAAHKLAPVIAATWFGKDLLRRLAYDKLSESDAVAELAQLASAAPEYRSQVRMLIDYMEAVGLVVRDGEFIKKASPQTQASNAPAERHAAPPPASHSEHRDPPREHLPARSSVSTAFTQMTGGMIQFNISVKVDMQEFSGWAPERIAAFFNGIAAVLAAKGAVEQEASRE
ncbi:MAG TPA: hypothetical protein VEY09_00360 [Pyrinomonadaceae bacterium]|nr:hypothetical protein [Pyrinomonadaceae bacterium]